jgi:hypothetical protein
MRGDRRGGKDRKGEGVMANMSYCRFENTFHDLEDCLEHINDDDLSESERRYRRKLIAACTEVHIDNKDDDDE